jgi:hypothetical protein
MQPINKCFVTHSYKLDIRNWKDKFFNNQREIRKTIKYSCFVVTSCQTTSSNW